MMEVRIINFSLVYVVCERNGEERMKEFFARGQGSLSLSQEDGMLGMNEMNSL